MRYLALIVISALCFCAHAQSVVWNNTPIPVSVKKDVEIRIDFPQRAMLRIPAQYTHSFRILYVNKSAYITALTEPLNLRAIAQQSDGTAYLLDMASSVTTPTDTVVSIVLPSESDDQANPSLPLASINYADLIRFALIHVYGELTHLPAINNIARTEITPTPIDLYTDSSLRTTPVAQWIIRTQQGNVFVSLIEVRNLTHQVRELSVHRIHHTKFLAGSVWPEVVYEAGAPNARSVAHIALITLQPIFQTP